jgi:hypothetical protein
VPELKKGDIVIMDKGNCKCQTRQPANCQSCHVG